MKLSIITVVLNRADTIEDCLRSVAEQTFEDVEHIIIDGGSSDGTLEIIDKYKNHIYKVISEKDNGIYDAMNKGIKLASGDVIGMLNADDIFYDEGVLSEIAAAFEQNEIDCIYGNMIYVHRKNTEKITRRWTSREFIDGLFERSWTPAHPTFYCRRELYEKYGFYRLDFKIAADVELMYRFLQRHKARSKYVDRMMVKMRNAGVSNSGIRSTITITKEMQKAISENGGKFNLIKYLFYKGLKIKQML